MAHTHTHTTITTQYTSETADVPLHVRVHKSMTKHPPTWGVHEIEVDEVINAQLLELEHNSAEIGPEDLRVRVVLHLVLVRLL